VQIFDVGSGDEPWLVMEILTGGDLQARVAADGPLALGPWRGLGEALLSALVTIHDAGMVHRDIKPANVLFAADGVAKLADFGIARMDDDAHLTETHQVVGTLRYMAPECLEGSPADHRSDLFSLGRTLTYALTGEARTRRRPSTCPAPDWAWLERCVDPRADQRHETLEEALLALRRLRGEFGGVEVPVAGSPRRSVGGPAVLMIGLGIVVAIAVARVLLGPPEEIAPAPNVPPPEVVDEGAGEASPAVLPALDEPVEVVAVEMKQPAPVVVEVVPPTLAANSGSETALLGRHWELSLTGTGIDRLQVFTRVGTQAWVEHAPAGSGPWTINLVVGDDWLDGFAWYAVAAGEGGDVSLGSKPSPRAVRVY
jgi:hypothetical protein